MSDNQVNSGLIPLCMLKQVHVIFRGRVQGVGFRFSARFLAAELDVKGWVSNLSDGTVEIVAEQDEPTLVNFISRLEGEFSGYVTGRDVQWEPAIGSFRGFSIK
jgi:acylphosphatase